MNERYYSLMLRFKVLTYFIIGVFFINLVSAATIYGAVYDLSLRKLSNARVEINTSPKQFLVAQNGSYSFDVPNGDYKIKVQLMQKNAVLASVQENITVRQNGVYVLDLILFPNIEEGFEDPDIDATGNIIESNNYGRYIVAGFFVIVILSASITFYYFNRIRKKKNEPATADKELEEDYESDGLEQVIKIIKSEGGRTTQKEIRKQIPLSEAKISLMIAELEHKGVIEKIKKGRGNIIILKRK